ncbi:hypothetical protein C9I57_18375 [Trinickia symbiotica]|uniref:Uncharacterized protein n=2 Tax=Trinickia symbiotica TaxID=863227 RepID=A0A2T3XR87_9BURK|nr:hypothetical protein C9I57_18375 [Trinickia symbiotica]
MGTMLASELLRFKAPLPGAYSQRPRARYSRDIFGTVLRATRASQVDFHDINASSSNGLSCYCPAQTSLSAMRPFGDCNLRM